MMSLDLVGNHPASAAPRTALFPGRRYCQDLFGTLRALPLSAAPPSAGGPAIPVRAGSLRASRNAFRWHLHGPSPAAADLAHPSGDVPRKPAIPARFSLGALQGSCLLQNLPLPSSTIAKAPSTVLVGLPAFPKPELPTDIRWPSLVVLLVRRVNPAVISCVHSLASRASWK